jgi:hypothetical protein
MTPSQAILAYGTTMKWNGTLLAEVQTIGAIGVTRDLVDVTYLNSPNHAKEYKAGWKDGKEFTVTMNFVPSDPGQVALMADFSAGTMREVIVIGPDGICTLIFDAVPVGNVELNFDKPAQIVATAVMKVTGDVVYGYTAAATLSALALTTATLVPAFNPDVHEYAATTTGTSFTVTPTCAGADTITVNDSVVATGVPSSAIASAKVDIYPVTIRTKEDDKVDSVYTVLVTKTA